MDRAPIALNRHRKGINGGRGLFTFECMMLAATSPEVVRATSVTIAIASAREGRSLAAKARSTAEEHRLVAITEIEGTRLRVTFRREEDGRAPIIA